MLSPLAMKKQVLGVWQQQLELDCMGNTYDAMYKAKQVGLQIEQLANEITALEAEAALKSPPPVTKLCEQLLQELWAKINAEKAAETTSSSLASSLPASSSTNTPVQYNTLQDTQHNTQTPSIYPQPKS